MTVLAISLIIALVCVCIILATINSGYFYSTAFGVFVVVIIMQTVFHITYTFPNAPISEENFKQNLAVGIMLLNLGIVYSATVFVTWYLFPLARKEWKK